MFLIHVSIMNCVVNWKAYQSRMEVNDDVHLFLEYNELNITYFNIFKNPTFITQ